MSADTTADPIEAHPLVVAALADVETAVADAEATRADLVAGSPVLPEHLAAADAKVEHARLLVDRARNEARREIASQERAHRLATSIADTVNAVGGPLGGAPEHFETIRDAIAAMWAECSQQTDTVRGLASTVAGMPKDRRHGLDAKTDATPDAQWVRTPDAVLVATPPLRIAAAALVDVLEANGVTAAALDTPEGEFFRSVKVLAGRWAATVATAHR